MDDENNKDEGGGGGGHLVLKRSELAILRRFADKYPIVPEERREAVEIVMKVARETRSPKTRLAAVKTLAALDRVNHDELATYLAARNNMGEELTPAQVIVNNQIVVRNVSVQSVLDDYADVIQGRGGQAAPPSLNGHSQSIHPLPPSS